MRPQVPRCFPGETAARIEAERQQAYLEMEAGHRAILSDPNASESDKRFARQMLDLS